MSTAACAIPTGVVAVRHLGSRPSPPAPEGWDKDITQAQHSYYSHHPRYIVCFSSTDTYSPCCSSSSLPVVASVLLIGVVGLGVSVSSSLAPRPRRVGKGIHHLFTPLGIPGWLLSMIRSQCSLLLFLSPTLILFLCSVLCS